MHQTLQQPPMHVGTSGRLTQNSVPTKDIDIMNEYQLVWTQALGSEGNGVVIPSAHIARDTRNRITHISLRQPRTRRRRFLSSICARTLLPLTDLACHVYPRAQSKSREGIMNEYVMLVLVFIQEL